MKQYLFGLVLALSVSAFAEEAKQPVPQVKVLNKEQVSEGLCQAAYKAGYNKALEESYTVMTGTFGPRTYKKGEVNGDPIIGIEGLSGDEVQACIKCGSALAREGGKLIKK